MIDEPESKESDGKEEIEVEDKKTGSDEEVVEEVPEPKL